MSLNFNTKGKQLTSLHLGIWLNVNSRSKNLPSGQILKMTTINDKDEKVYMDLEIRDNILRCNLYDPEKADMK